MKKSSKFALVGAAALVSVSVSGAVTQESASANFLQDICSATPLVCQLSLMGNGSGKEPPDFPKPIPEKEK